MILKHQTVKNCHYYKSQLSIWSTIIFCVAYISYDFLFKSANLQFSCKFCLAQRSLGIGFGHIWNLFKFQIYSQELSTSPSGEQEFRYLLSNTHAFYKEIFIIEDITMRNKLRYVGTFNLRFAYFISFVWMELWIIVVFKNYEFHQSMPSLTIRVKKKFLN